MTTATTTTTTEGSPPPSLLERYDTAMADLASLGRVSHRLALIDSSDRLQQVLSKLLPKLIQRIGDNHQQQLEVQRISNDSTTTTTTTTTTTSEELKSMIQDALSKIYAKLIETLSHTMKRVRQDPSVQLPCAALLELLLEYDKDSGSSNTTTTTTTTAAVKYPKANPNVNPFVLNLSLTFLSMGIPRCHSLDELQQVLPGFLVWNGYFSHWFETSSFVTGTTGSTLPSGTIEKYKTQWRQIAHLLLRTLEQLVVVVGTTRTNTRARTNNSANTTRTSSSSSSTSSLTTSNDNSSSSKRYKPSDSTNANDSNNNNSNDNNPFNDNFNLARTLCRQNIHHAGQALYDLILDVLLYHPTRGNIPPPGLSQFASDKLQSGPSSNSTTTTGTSSGSSGGTTATAGAPSNTPPTFANEMAQRSRLVQVKLHLLDLISPQKHWGLLWDRHSSFTNTTCHEEASLGLARTLVLVVVASGDNTPEVSQQASVYLKQHLDSTRIATTNSNETTERNSSSLSSSPFSHPIYGHPLAVLSAILTLCVGDTNADLALARLQQQHQSLMKNDNDNEMYDDNDEQQHDTIGSSTTPTLGFHFDSYQSVTDQEMQQFIMSHKRRMVSDTSFTALTNFVTKVLTDMPQVLSYRPFLKNSNQKQQQQQQQQQLYTIASVSMLVTVAASKTLSNLRTSQGLSMARGAKYIAAAQLLQALVIRLGNISTVSSTLLSVMAKCLAIACQGLSTVSSSSLSRSTTTAMSITSDGNIAVRDALYGVICALSRSSVLSVNKGNVEDASIHSWLFEMGKTTTSDSNTTRSVSIETASLLFGCFANEEDRLRPRVVAALDALLGAYCRVYNTNDDNSNNYTTTSELIMTPANDDVDMRDDSNPTTNESNEMSSNPWSTVATPTSFNAPVQANMEKKTKLAVALIPLLWSASQPSQPNASRVAAARWASDLLKPLDVVNACHLLCFLSGDADGTAASIAKEALGPGSGVSIQTETTSTVARNQDYTTTFEATSGSESNLTSLPDFGAFTTILFSSSSTTTTTSTGWRPKFWDFSPQGKSACVLFTLNCLFQDLYGGEDDALTLYLFALTKTLQEVSTSVLGSSSTSTHQRDYVELLDESATCLSHCLSTSSHSRSLLLNDGSTTEAGSAPISLGLRDLETLALTASSSRARRHLAECCGYLYEDDSLWQEHKTDVGWLETLEHPLTICAQELDGFRVGSPSRMPVAKVHGAAFLGATCVRAFRLNRAAENTDNHGSSESSSSPKLQHCWDLACTILSSLGGGTLHADDTIGNAFADGLAIAMAYPSVDAPVLDERLYGGMTMALTYLGAAIRKYGNSSENLQANNTTALSRTSKLAAAAGICLAASTSGAGAIVTSKANLPRTEEKVDVDGMANISNVQASDSHSVVHKLGPARLDCVEALFLLLGSTSFRKDEEIALIAGEALAWYADAFSPKYAVWSSQTSKWPEELDESFATMLPPHQQVLYTLLRRINITSNPHKRTSCAPALLALVARAASRVNRDSGYAHRSLVIELCTHLIEIQTAFTALLADPKSKHLCRESCCLGLAACRGLAEISRLSTGCDHTEEGATSNDVSYELNDKLLRAFGQTSNYGASAMMETRAQAEARRRANAASTSGSNPAGINNSSIMEPFGEETEVGGTSGLGEAALGAYREMAAAAVSLGRPDVLYALLMLSVSHSVWFTAESREKYSASALLGKESILGSRTNATKMREALRPHLGKLLPRMLRACHDPNKQTREQMSNLWNGLSGGGAEARLAISQHLLPTMDVLMEDATSKLWRARVGACGALSQIIVARSWQELGGGKAVLDDDDVITGTTTSCTTAGARLLRLWRVSMRSLDDIRGAVRESGETLARGVRSLTIRLCDPSAMQKPGEISGLEADYVQHEQDASAAAGTALRWLIKRGLNQPCPEATGVCVSCLVGIVDVAKPSILQPLIPELLRSLLFAMSGLEPAALSFLQVRAAGEDATSGSYDRLERLRLQLAQSGPLTTAVSKCLAMLPSVDLETQKAVIPQLDAALRLSAGFASRAATADAVSTLCSTCPYAFKFAGTSSTNPSVRLLRALYFASERERGQAARDKMAHALGNLAALCPGTSVRALALRACDRYNSSTGNNDDPAARRAAAVALRSIAVRASSQFSDGGNSDVWCRRVLPVAYLGMKDSDAKVASLWKEVWEEGGSTANLAGAGDDYGSLLEEKLLPSLVKECVKALQDVSWTRRVNGSVALGDLADANILTPDPSNIAKAQNAFSDSERSRRRAQASCAALVVAVPIVAGSRLWSGKLEVVKASVKIASKWCARSVTDSGKNGPIMVSPTEFQNDLFVGDAWFAEEAMEMEIDDNEQENQDCAVVMEVEEGKEGAKIDFEEGDKILETENQEAITSDEVHSVPDDSARLVTFSGLCRILLKQAFPSSTKSMLSVSEEEILPYRAAALEGFRDLMSALGGSPEAQSQKKDIFRRVSSTLIAVLQPEANSETDRIKKEEAPLIVARSVECLSSSFWEGMGTKEDSVDLPASSVLDLAKTLETAGGASQAAWTVREAAALGCANLVTKSDSDALKSYVLISSLVDFVAQALRDRKFWRVRYAGLRLLQALVVRAGSPSDSSMPVSVSVALQQDEKARDRQMVLEAMLPNKETMLKLARQSLSDSEAKVTALSSEILSALAWWP